jgi:hypothetical protein
LTASGQPRKQTVGSTMAGKALWTQLPNQQAFLKRLRRSQDSPAGAGRLKGRLYSGRKTRKPISQKSKAQRGKDAEYQKAKSEWWPSVRGQHCPVMLAIFKRLVLVTPKPHHMRGRLGPLLCDTQYWLAVSREGHDWIHRNIAEARKRKWYAEPGEWNQP